MKKCYLCDSNKIRPTLLQRRIRFDSQTFNFYYCKNCSGYSLFPKLNELQVQALYSLDYVANLNWDLDIVGSSEWDRFIQLHSFFKSQPKLKGAKFLDYGCGADPVTFKVAKQFQMEPAGMEFSQDVRESVFAATRIAVYSRDEILNSSNRYDIIFLGDVIEHLFYPTSELQLLNTKLNPGGILIAQGPLQGAQTLTHLVVKLFAIFTRKRISTFPPYHASLATTKSMWLAMQSSGFININIECSEVQWPAPNLNEVLSKPNLRNLILFLTKSFDKLIAKLFKKYGSRYFLVCNSYSSSAWNQE